MRALNPNVDWRTRREANPAAYTEGGTAALVVAPGEAWGLDGRSARLGLLNPGAIRRHTITAALAQTPAAIMAEQAPFEFDAFIIEPQALVFVHYPETPEGRNDLDSLGGAMEAGMEVVAHYGCDTDKWHEMWMLTSTTTSTCKGYWFHARKEDCA